MRSVGLEREPLMSELLHGVGDTEERLHCLVIDLDDFAGHVAVCLAVHGLDSFGVRCLADAEPHLLVQVDQRAEEARPVLVLDGQVEAVHLEHVLTGEEHSSGGRLVPVDVERHRDSVRRTVAAIIDRQGGRCLASRKWQWQEH